VGRDVALITVEACFMLMNPSDFLPLFADTGPFSGSPDAGVLFAVPHRQGSRAGLAEGTFLWSCDTFSSLNTLTKKTKKRCLA